MQRRTNIQVSSLIILLSILTILTQFVTYYFFEAFILIWGVSCLISFLSCHILLEQSTTYEACFNYSFLTIFISLLLVVVTYFGNTTSFLPFTNAMLGIVIINWFIPMFHCFLRYMLDYGTKIDDFISFYRNDSILFFVFYIVFLLYIAISKNSFPWIYPSITVGTNLVPFQIIATLIEDYLYELIPLRNIVIYLVTRILIYLPYGFYIALLLRRQTRLPRYFALLLLPFMIEIAQFIFIPARCDIDDLIYAFIGGTLGTLIFYLTNIIFHAISGKDFLRKDSDHRFYNSSLHF